MKLKFGVAAVAVCGVRPALSAWPSGSRSPTKSHGLHVEAVNAYRDSLCWLNLADLHNTVAARKGYSDWQGQPAWTWDTDFSSLRYHG